MFGFTLYTVMDINGGLYTKLECEHCKRERELQELKNEVDSLKSKVRNQSYERYYTSPEYVYTPFVFPFIIS